MSKTLVNGDHSHNGAAHNSNNDAGFSDSAICPVIEENTNGLCSVGASHTNAVECCSSTDLEAPGSVGQTSVKNVREPISGFLLISVKHLSRVPKGKPVKNSNSAIRLGQMETYNADSPVDESSPNSSQSSNGEDLSRDDLYGSGSVEAEEFEDDEPVEDDGAGEVCGILVDGKNVGQISNTAKENGPHFGERTPSVPVAAIPKVNQGSGTITPQIHPSTGLTDPILTPGHFVPSDHKFSPTVLPISRPLPLNGHTYQHVPTPYGMFSPGRRSSLMPEVLLANAQFQLNNSYIESQLISRLPSDNASLQTAPLSTHISLDQYSELHSTSESSVPEPYIVNENPTNHAGLEPAQDSAHASMLYPHCDHSQHAPYSRSRITCLHYLHSGGHSDSHPSRLMTSNDVDPLAPVDATLAAASLPPLQPASRFRKARIHETVEQWSHGRASVHDCHLRTVPEWVSELQKKLGTLERDMTTALEHKFNCFSCLELKALDHNHSGAQTVRKPTKTKSLTVGLQHSWGNDSGKPAKSKADSTRNSLFAFWDGGSRVHCPMSCMGRVAPIPGSAIPDQATQETDLCLLCVHSLITQNAMFASKDSREHHPFTLDLPKHEQFEAGINSNRVADYSVEPMISSTTLLNSVLSSNSADPATAYLRRQQSATTFLHPMQSSTYPERAVRHGDSPSATDQFSVVPTESTRVTPDSVDYVGRLQSPYQPSTETAPHLALTKVHPIDELNVPLPDSTGRLSKPDVTGLAPPTSPTFVDGLDPPSGIGATDIPTEVDLLNNGVGLLNEQQATSFPEGFVISERRRNAVSGDYQNVTTSVGQPPMDNDPRASVKPPSSPTSFQADARVPRPTQSLLNDGPHNGHAVDAFASSAVLTPGKILHTSESLQSAPLLGQHFSMNLTFSSSDVPFESNRISACGLEERISRSMDVIRSAMENAFQRELAAVHSENVRLTSEVERLSNEVLHLRGYQAAFYALRPFVTPEVWERLQQHQRFGGTNMGSENVTFPTPQQSDSKHLGQ